MSHRLKIFCVCPCGSRMDIELDFPDFEEKQDAFNALREWIKAHAKHLREEGPRIEIDTSMVKS